jgi:hypothetical protein
MKLRTDQVAALSFAMAHKKSLNLSDPGVGKTAPTIINMYRRLEEGKRTVWVQPKSLIAKNVEEILAWTPLTRECVAVVDGTPAKVDAAMNSGAGILLMGPDRFKRTHNWPVDLTCIDVDEQHMCFGHHTSARTEAFYRFSERAEEMVLMTGSLINGRLDTAYPSIQAIEPRYYPFGYDQFLDEHAYLDDYGRPESWTNHGRIGEILANHAIRFTFEQIHGPQEIVKQVQWVAMSDKQRAAYAEFEREALLELDDFMIDGTLPGVATTRARQIMEHPNCFPDLRDKDNLPPVDITPGETAAKLDALEIHFEDHKRRGTPVVVFAALVPQMLEIKALAQRMGLRSEVIYGAVSMKDRARIDEAFRAGTINVLVCSPPCAAVGYNWQDWGLEEVDHVIFASLTYMHTDFIQGYRRTVRRNRRKALRVTTLGYLNSIDIRLMTILETKSRDANLVDPTTEVVKFMN